MVKRSFAALGFSLAVLAASGAWARWQTGGVGPVTPTDLNLVDAGVAVVASDTRAQAVYMGPFEAATVLGAAVTDAGAMAGGRVGPGGCVFAMARAPAVLVGTTPQCGVPTTLDAMGHLFLSSPSGAAWAATDDDSTQGSTQVHGDGGYDPAWLSYFGTLGAATMAVTTVAGQDWAVRSAEGGTAGTLARPPLVGSGVSFVRAHSDLAIFPNGSVAALLLAFHDGGMSLKADVSATAAAPVPVTLPPAGEVRALAFTIFGGDALGRGLGFAVTDAGLFGAVPNPAAPGQVWVRRPEAAFADTVRVRCLDAANCALLRGGPGPNPTALNWYFNVAAPQTPDGGAVRLSADAGATFRAAMPVADPDGDPIWITWAADAGALGLAPVGGSSALLNEQADFTVPASVACGLTAFPFTFWASDGLAAHATLLGGLVEVSRSEPPAAPVFTPAAVQVFAGLGPASSTYALPGGGCPAATTSTAYPADAGFTLTISGNTVTVTPSPTYCGPGGSQTFTYMLGNDAGQAQGQLTIDVVPWGAPTLGSFTCAPLLRLDAGSSAECGVAMAHACQGANGFPGLELLLSVDGGGPTVAVTRSPDGGVVVTSSDACTSASLQLFAKAQVRGEDAGRVSAGTATLDVAVVPNYPPVLASQFDAGFAPDEPNARLVGDLWLGAVCGPQRGHDARIAVYGSAGTVISGPQRFPIFPDGGWELAVPGGCNGGAFFGKAELMSGPSPTGIEQVFPFSTSFRPAGVGAVTPAQVAVRCGEPVVISAAAFPMDGGCARQEYAWRQLGGPDLEVPSLAGQQVELLSRVDFDSLGGAAIELEVEADAGSGNAGGRLLHRIALEPARFVRLTHSFEPVPAREGESLPVRALLENTSGCDVSGLVLKETPGRLRFVAGSARADGRPVDAALVGDALEVGPLAIPARGRLVVTWLARAPLLLRPRVQGTVLMRQVPVELPPEAELPASCSCGASGTSGVLGALGLAALARLLSRRRRTCR